MKEFVKGMSQSLLPHFCPIESYCETIFSSFVQIDKLIRPERQTNDWNSVINRFLQTVQSAVSYERTTALVAF